MTPERGRERLPSVVRQLGAVSFFNDVASEMVYPLLPTLVTVRLGGTAFSLAALDGIAEAISSGVKLGAGWLAERTRRRSALVVGGYALAAVVRPVMGLVGAAWQVVVLRAGDRVGKGVRTPARDAVIADAVPATLRGRAFGYHRAMDHAGAVLGPLAAAVLLAVGLAVSTVVLWSVVPGLVAVVVVAWAMHRARGTAQDGEGTAEPGITPRGKVSRGSLALVFGFAFVRFPETLLLLRLHDLGVSVAMVPVLWALLHVVRSVASYPGGWLSDAVGPLRTMQAGWIAYALVCAGLATATVPVAGVGWFLVFGVVAALTESPERALVAALGGAARHGRRFGAYHAGVGLAALPGALLIGVLWVRFGGPVTLAASGAAAALLAAAAMPMRTGAG